MTQQYTVLIVGVGKRGLHHATAFQANPRFRVAALCGVTPARLAAAAAKIGGGVKTGTDAAAPPAPLRGALSQGQGNHCRWGAGTHPHRLWQRDRLDDAHALSPH